MKLKKILNDLQNYTELKNKSYIYDKNLYDKIINVGEFT